MWIEKENHKIRNPQLKQSMLSAIRSPAEPGVYLTEITDKQISRGIYKIACVQ
jgi:hypothetical protein